MAGATERSALDDIDALPRELLAGSDPEAALLPVLDGLARAFGYERSLVAMVDDRARVIRGRFGRGIADQIAEAFTVPLANLQDPSVVAFHSGVTQRVDDVASDERISATTREVLTELGFETFVVWPSFSRSSVISIARRCPGRALAGSMPTIVSSNAVSPTASRCRFIR